MPVSRKLRRLSLILLSTGFFAVAACSSSNAGGNGSGSAAPTSQTAAAASQPGAEDPAWQKVVAAANEEGHVTWYSNNTDSGNQALLKEFEQLYPKIKVSYTRINSGTIVTRIAQEAATGVNALDVVTLGVPTLYTQHANLFLTLTPTLVPALSMYSKSAARFPQAENYTTNTFAIGYNKSEVSASEVPKTWSQIVDSQWKGQIAYASPVATTTHIAFVSGLQHFYGDEFLKKWGQMQWQLFDTADPAVQAMVAGSDKLALIVFPGDISVLAATGAPVGYVVPTPVMVTSSTISIAAKAPDPDAARVFANFILSKEGQEAYCKTTVSASPLGNLPGCVDVPSNAFPLKDVWTTQDRTPLLNLIGLKPTS